MVLNIPKGDIINAAPKDCPVKWALDRDDLNPAICARARRF